MVAVASTVSAALGPLMVSMSMVTGVPVATVVVPAAASVTS